MQGRYPSAGGCWSAALPSLRGSSPLPASPHPPLRRQRRLRQRFLGVNPVVWGLCKSRGKNPLRCWNSSRRFSVSGTDVCDAGEEQTAFSCLFCREGIEVCWFKAFFFFPLFFLFPHFFPLLAGLRCILPADSGAAVYGGVRNNQPGWAVMGRLGGSGLQPQGLLRLKGSRGANVFSFWRGRSISCRAATPGELQ